MCKGIYEELYVPLMEFSYNNIYQASIGMTPYKALYGWNIVKDTEEKVQVIRQRLKVASDRQKSYVDLKRKDIEYEVSDKVFLKVSP